MRELHGSTRCVVRLQDVASAIQATARSISWRHVRGEGTGGLDIVTLGYAANVNLLSHTSKFCIPRLTKIRIFKQHIAVVQSIMPSLLFHAIQSLFASASSGRCAVQTGVVDKEASKCLMAIDCQ